MRLIFSLLLFSCLISCAGVETDTITLNPQKTEAHVNLSEDIWVLKPSGFSRAQSYEGFQNDKWNVQSSISYEKKYVDFQRVKNSFDQNYLKTKRTVLLESRDVVFEDSDLENGYFTKVRDARKGTIRYLLAIPKDGIIHNIKGFCMNEVEKKYDEKIKKAIFSAVFAEKIEKVESFIMADVDLSGKMTFTRDGKFPPENENQDLIEVIPLKGDKYNYDSEIKRYINNIFKERMNVEKISTSLRTGGEYRAKKERRDMSLMVRVVPVSGGDRVAILAQSLSSQIPEDISAFIDHKLFKTTIRKE